VTIIGETTTGNAKQHFDGYWNSVIDTDGTLTPQGFPFLVTGATGDCGCASVLPPKPDSNVCRLVANRYISFVPGNAGRETALRVTIADMPAAFAGMVGESFWVGPPFDLTEAPGSDGSEPPVFTAARLQCAPYFTDWSTVGTVQVVDAAIVAGGIYDIQAVAEGCEDDLEGAYSAPLPVATSANWGDITGNCGVSPCSPPEGVIDFIDIAAIVDKFKDNEGAPAKARTDLAGDTPDLKVDFVDILYEVEAFKGEPFPFGGPVPCE
jgi:hypothetical protein